MNKFKYSDDNKRYHSFNYYLKNHYRNKVFKVSLNAGFSCPNRTGEKSYGGCTFCSQDGSGDFAGDVNDDLMKQFNDVKEQIHQKWANADHIAYFQAYSNTYAPVEELKKIYDPFLKIPSVKALAIATRPDCLDEKIVAYLDSLTSQKDIWLELGLQTTDDKIAASFNRGYDFQTFIDALNLLKDTNIKVCVHIINGLPDETKEMMIQNVKRISHFKIDAIKIHMLHLINNSQMGRDYQKKPFSLLSLDEYVKLVVEQLRYLPDDVVVQRLTGDAKKEDLIAPEWILNKTNVLNSIDKYMAANDFYQGDLYE